ncbi:hypothetical protein BO85DRAFT_451551 [Aspergillus piperis CBS 112811]|uniref:Uncharacterized protein n=1 Tax=Aspergillus piperis CBS 112811 TaxID=1448313 RepID=A0A8G1QWY3_9EURO|nr:hypothetical protein BO85DRAFT_451551 [Aspergillus piperis CBS 112811]XP_035357804.1 uncharacterized protein AtWU_06802 [Aspergillus tubingensis]RAH55209.1 hypothetical protein BO85DRAFT_451551 [Aspergillus piperis CBS 112811]GFN17000.1 hypothetical protein AtWU_06802 [Aspergillus tubingensis]
MADVLRRRGIYKTTHWIHPLSQALGIAYRQTSLETLSAKAGVAYSYTVDFAGTSIKRRYPRVVEGRIQGTTPHLSSKDKADGQKVVTVGFHARNGTRYLSIHAHGDGTWKEFLSRAGKAVLRKERDGSQRRAMQGRLSRSSC